MAVPRDPRRLMLVINPKDHEVCPATRSGPEPAIAARDWRARWVISAVLIGASALVPIACGSGGSAPTAGTPGASRASTSTTAASDSSTAATSSAQAGIGPRSAGSASSALADAGPHLVDAGPHDSGSGSSATEGQPGIDASDAALGGEGGTLGKSDASADAGGTALVSDGGAIFPPGVTSPKITIIGDSVSAGPGCYKKYLLQDLTTNGYSKFSFVGLYADSCSGGTVRHSAVSCSTAAQWTQPTFTMPNCSQGMSFAGMSTVVQQVMPDMIMLQLGVNDVWGGQSTETILGNYTKLITQARAENKNMVFVVAMIQKIMPNCNDTAAYDGAQALVSAVPAWARSMSSSESPVFTADLWTNSVWEQTETIDCVHPNDTGAQKMAMNWFNALKDILPK